MKHEDLIRFRHGLAKNLDQPNMADLLEGAVNAVKAQWPQIHSATRIRRVESGTLSATVNSPAGAWQILIDQRIPYKSGVTTEAHFFAQYDRLGDILYVRLQS